MDLIRLAGHTRVSFQELFETFGSETVIPFDYLIKSRHSFNEPPRDMGESKKPQRSKNTTASTGLFDYLQSILFKSPSETNRTACVDHNSSSYNLLGTTTRSDKTNITNNYVKTEGGISAKDAATFVAVGAAVVAGGCLLGAHLTSGSPSNNEGPGDNNDTRQSQQAPPPYQSHSSHGVDTATMDEAIIIETPHIKVRAAAVRKRSTNGTHSTLSPTKSSAQEGNKRKLKAEALQILRS